MRQSAAISTYERAYVVCFERWREWCDPGGIVARKRYSAAISVVSHARSRCEHARHARPHCARMTHGKWLAWIPCVVDGIVFDDHRAAEAWCALPYGIGAPVEWIAG